MTVAGGLEIRPGSVADLPALVAVSGQRRWFSDQLARQRAGDVYLSLEPDPNQVVRRHLPGVPTLVHLEVLGPYQRRGHRPPPRPQRPPGHRQ
jgi:hypothetical protein